MIAMTIQEFYDMLAAHDWQAEHSDDHEKWLHERGSRAVLRQQAANMGPVYNDLYLDFITSTYSGVLPCRPS